MTDNYGEMAGWMGLLTGSASEAIDVTSRRAVRDGRYTGTTDGRVISVPANCLPNRLAQLGIEILDDLPPEDERKGSFVRVRLPDGWTVVPGEDPRLQYIVDPTGVKRIRTTDNGQFWDRYVSTIVLHQGNFVSTELCYGEATLQDMNWGKLTAEERAEVIEELESLARKYPDEQSGAKAIKWLREIERLEK